MKIKNLFAVAALLLGSTSAFAQGSSSSGIFKFTYDASDNATITGFRADITAGELADGVTIPETLTNTEEKTFKVVAIGANAFNQNASVKGAFKKVSIAKTVAEIGASAFNGCNQLEEVEFATGSLLAKLGDYAFGNTPALTSIDFTKCSKMADFDQGAGFQYPFIPSATGKNNYLKTIVLNPATEDLGLAFANLTVLSSLNVEDTQIAAIGDDTNGAFANDAALKALELPASCVTINGKSLMSSSIETLTINSVATKAQTIDAAVFGGTDVLKTLVFSGVFKGDITAGAFVGTKINSVTFGELNAKSATGIAAGAIVLADAASTVTIAKISAADVYAAGAITGPATATNKVALTINNVNAAITNKVVSTNVGVATIGDLNEDFSMDVVGDAQTVTFTKPFAEGKKFAAATAVTATKVVFGTEEAGIALAAGTVVTNAFKGATGMSIYWKPAVATKAFAVDFIQAASGGTYGTEATTQMKNKLYTTTAVGEAYTAPADFLNNAEILMNVYIVAAATAPESKTIEMASNDEKTYFGKFIAADGNYKIAKADAIVYAAYVDGSDIYMLPLRAKKGFYVVNMGEGVVVKATKAGDITAEGTADAHTMLYKEDGSGILNEIQPYVDPTDANVILDLPLNSGKDVYAVAKIENYGLTWKKFKATITMPANTLCIPAEKAAAGRLNIVWLDEEGNTTAIQKIETEKVNDGAIYNLAGQKVNASYKGVVIKNGKKMIQK